MKTINGTFNDASNTSPSNQGDQQHDVNKEPESSSKPIKLTKSKSFAALLSGVILIIGAVLMRDMYHGPGSILALCILGASGLVLAFLVYFSSVKM
jgi:hypothetical protein